MSLLDGPTSAPVGAVVVRPGVDSLPALNTSNAAGTTFYLLAGKHTLGTGQFDQVQPKAGNTYIGAPGAVIDGQFLNQYAFTGTAAGVTIRYLEVCNFVCPTDQFVVNHDTGDNWTIEYCNIHSTSAAAVGVGNGTVLRYCWLHHNKQYGFSSFNDVVNDALSPAVNNVTIDHNEVQGNGDPLDEFNASGNPLGNGRNGSCKFWDTSGIVMTSNWIHHGLMGMWADTNNIHMRFENNLVEDIWAEGFFYEISYNFLVQFNTFRRCCLGQGMRSNYTPENFPYTALYVSESGSEPRIATAYNTISEIRFNKFLNNWGDISLWENADRFANSVANTSFKIWKPLGGAASMAVCNNPTPKVLTVTLTAGSPLFTVTSGTLEYSDEGRGASGSGIPGGTSLQNPVTANAFVGGFIDATHGRLDQNATASGSLTMTLAAGSINVAPYYYDCRWHTQHVHIHNNQFDHNQAEVLGANNTLTAGVTTGKHAIISQVGSSPSWSPYQGSTIETAITFNQDNVWSNNAYRGDYTQWMPFDTAHSENFTQWQAAPYHQDAGSTFSGTPPTGNGGGTYYKPSPPTSVIGTAGDGQVRVSFIPPIDTGGDQVIGYTVTSSPDGITATAVTGPITVSGLTNNTAYTFTVKTRTTIGDSVDSAASGSVTPNTGASLAAATIPWHPRYVTARPRTGTTAEVSFVQPSSDGGSTITGYTVTSSPGGLTATGTTGPITVSGLTTDQAYTFTVHAINAVGNSPESPASDSVTPTGSAGPTVPDAPTIGTATAGNGSASVTFTPPGSDGGSTITGYTATSSPGSITGTGSASPLTVSGLTNGNAYTFTVHATNAIGNSAESAASNSVTPTGSSAPTFGAAGNPTSGATSTSIDIAAPASVVDGSVVLAFIARDDSVQNTPYESVTPPADWTQVSNNPGSAGATDSSHTVLCDVFWHRATGAESGPYTFTWATARFCTGAAVRLDGCQATGTPFEAEDGANSTGTGVQANTPAVAVTTTDVNRLLVWGGWTWTGGAWTFPSGFTAQVNNVPFDLCVVATKVAASAGATGSIAGSQNASEPHAAWVGAFVGT